MDSNKKITLIIFSMVTLLTIVIVALVALGSRQSGYDGAKKRAYLTADIVKKSLTTHMINGNMHQRETFLNSISQLEEINDLWIIRATSVSKQFGKSTIGNEVPRDEIDKEVLRTGKEIVLPKESLKSATLRITIPYTASSIDKPNCLSCHNAKEGEVLGAISLKFDIQDDRISSISVLLNIIAIITIFLILILIYISRKIKPYTSSFDSITEVLKQVHEGNYSIRAKDGVLKEDKEAFQWLNEIIENASHKAYNGKEIAGKMIEGYIQLNENISQTIHLISDIEMASKEQLQGIEQINDAVNSLDKQTQQNASIASQTNTIAEETDNISQAVLKSAEDKKFVGKDEVTSNTYEM